MPQFQVQWPQRRLGRTGLMVSPLGFGGAGIGGVFGDVTDEEAVACVHFALEQGMNFFDTDASYGESERRLGLALRGIPRKDYVLSTKCGTHPARHHDYSRDGVLWNVENSLRLLGTEYLDIVLVHDPSDMAPLLAPRGTFAALAELQEQGVIGAIGLGQRRHTFHAQAIAAGQVSVILTYKDYNPIRTTAAPFLLDLAARHDVGVLNGSPLATGLLAGGSPDDAAANIKPRPSKRDLDAAHRLCQWCQEKRITETAIALQFCLREGRIQSTLVGVKTRAELEHNLQAVCDPLPEEVWQELAALHLTSGLGKPEEFCAPASARP